MTEEKYQVRLSIEVNGLKDHEFTSQLYFIIRPISELGMKAYRSSPTVAITNPRVETKIETCFKSYLFELEGRSELKARFSQNVFIELWHNDRIKKDILLGIAKFPLNQIMEQPLRKNQTSYVLSLDAWIPVDEVNEEENPIRKIGAIRTVAYLEDLGPVNMLKQKGFDIKNLLAENELPDTDPQHENPYLNNNIPSENPNNYADETKRLELNNLEQKVVWELETWKKTEEARAKLVLKQKEAEFWTGLAEQQKKSDIEKEKQLKKVEANLNLLETKLKAKMSDLMKREQKLVVMEQELESKIKEISREVFLKDEEIDRLRKKQKEEKTVLVKEKSGVELELAKCRAENARLKVELEEALKEDEKSEVNTLKNALTHRISEIKELTRELENCMEIKQQFQESYEKMKRELIEKAAVLREKSDQLNGAETEMRLMKRDIQHLEEKLNLYKQKQFYANNYAYGASGEQEEEEEPESYNNKNGYYDENDVLIREIDKKVSERN